MTTSYEVNFLFVHEFCICQIEHWMDHIAPYFRHQITEIDKQITVETLFMLFVATEEAIPHTAHAYSVIYFLLRYKKKTHIQLVIK